MLRRDDLIMRAGAGPCFEELPCQGQENLGRTCGAAVFFHCLDDQRIFARISVALNASSARPSVSARARAKWRDARLDRKGPCPRSR